MQCAATEDTCELQAYVVPLTHFKEKWHNNQLDLAIYQFTKTTDDAGEVCKAPMRELFNKYAYVFTKPGKPVARGIKHKTELLNPAKPIPNHRMQRISET